MANIKGIHHVYVSATDYDKSYEFYTKGLGFTAVHEWGEGESRACMIDVGDGCCIELFPSKKKNDYNLIEKYTKENLDKIPGFDAGIFSHLCFRVENTDEAYEMAMKAGAVSAKTPMDGRINSKEAFDMRIAFVFGPDGEVIEFFEIKE